jgi:hypothetical protein
LGVFALSGPADEEEEGGEIVEATPEELRAAEEDADPVEEESVEPGSEPDPESSPTKEEDPNENRAPEEEDPVNRGNAMGRPEPKPDLSHIPPLRAQMKARAGSLKLKDTGFYAYVPEAMDGRPMLLLSQPGGAVARRMRMVGPVGEEGRYRCTAAGSIALTHGSFALAPLARHLGVKLRFAPVPVEKPRKV